MAERNYQTGSTNKNNGTTNQRGSVNERYQNGQRNRNNKKVNPRPRGGMGQNGTIRGHFMNQGYNNHSNNFHPPYEQGHQYHGNVSPYGAPNHPSMGQPFQPMAFNSYPIPQQSIIRTSSPLQTQHHQHQQQQHQQQQQQPQQQVQPQATSQHSNCPSPSIVNGEPIDPGFDDQQNTGQSGGTQVPNQIPRAYTGQNPVIMPEYQNGQVQPTSEYQGYPMYAITQPFYPPEPYGDQQQQQHMYNQQFQQQYPPMYAFQPNYIVQPGMPVQSIYPPYYQQASFNTGYQPMQYQPMGDQQGYMVSHPQHMMQPQQTPNAQTTQMTQQLTSPPRPTPSPHIQPPTTVATVNSVAVEQTPQPNTQTQHQKPVQLAKRQKSTPMPKMPHQFENSIPQLVSGLSVSKPSDNDSKVNGNVEEVEQEGKEILNVSLDTDIIDVETIEPTEQDEEPPHATLTNGLTTLEKPEGTESDKENDDQEHKGQFLFKWAGIDDDSNDEIMLTEVTNLSSLRFTFDDDKIDQNVVPVLSKGEEKLLILPKFSEYRTAKSQINNDEANSTESIHLEKSIEFVNSALSLDEGSDTLGLNMISFGISDVVINEVKTEEINNASNENRERTVSNDSSVTSVEVIEQEGNNVVTLQNDAEEDSEFSEELNKSTKNSDVVCNIENAERNDDFNKKKQVERKKSEDDGDKLKPAQLVTNVGSPVINKPKVNAKRMDKKEVENPVVKEPAFEEEVRSISQLQADLPIYTNSGPLPVAFVPVQVMQQPKVARRSWAHMLKSTQPEPVMKAPVQQPVKKVKEKRENDINVDPIAKKITDIIYSEDEKCDDFIGAPRGLINQANNCWVNSLLQTALVCDPLYKLLKKLLFYTQSTVPGKNDKEIAQIGNEIKRMLPTCAKLAEVFGEILCQKDNQRIAYEPVGVYAQISKLNPDLTDGQHDAEEALSLLLNAMHDEIVTVRKAAGHIGGSVNVGQMIEPEAGDGWKTTTKSGRVMKSSVSCSGDVFDSSPISEGFRGLSHSSIRIQGDHASPPPTEQPFFTLQLDVASPLSPTNIDDVIKNLPREENLEDYKLKDGTAVTANRKMSLARLPPILILHMKRFLYNATDNKVEKLEKQISIKERIELPRECISPGLRDRLKRTPCYDLHGLVLHHGVNAEGGHYTAETKRNNKWYKVDDNKVSEVKLKDIINCDPNTRRTPYLLFYKKVNNSSSK